MTQKPTAEPLRQVDEEMFKWSNNPKDPKKFAFNEQADILLKMLAYAYGSMV